MSFEEKTSMYNMRWWALVYEDAKLHDWCDPWMICEGNLESFYR